MGERPTPEELGQEVVGEQSWHHESDIQGDIATHVAEIVHAERDEADRRVAEECDRHVAKVVAEFDAYKARVRDVLVADTATAIRLATIGYGACTSIARQLGIDLDGEP